jgi:hypothetical protein
VRILLLQFVGNALLAVLAVAWLQIPDSHTWQLVLSVLFALLGAAAFLWLHATIVRSLRKAPSPAPFWLGLILLLLWLLVLHELMHFAAHFGDDAGVYQRAGYWNSQLSPHQRRFFTFERLIRWQTGIAGFVEWSIVPALSLPFLIETVSAGVARASWRNALRTLLRWQHWLAVIVLTSLGRWIVGGVLDWHPSKTVRGELLSAALRLGLAYLIGFALLTWVLAAVAELLSRNDAPVSPNDELEKSDNPLHASDEPAGDPTP